MRRSPAASTATPLGSSSWLVVAGLPVAAEAGRAGAGHGHQLSGSDLGPQPGAVGGRQLLDPIRRCERDEQVTGGVDGQGGGRRIGLGVRARATDDGDQVARNAWDPEPVAALRRDLPAPGSCRHRR